MASVTLKNLRKRFPNGFEAVKNVNLDIVDKEFIIFVGPSGCGKTTTLRMIAGLEDVTEGEILIGDKSVEKVAPKDRDIAMVFQNYALYPHMTVFKNMAIGLELRKVDKAEIRHRVHEAAKMLGIEPLLDRRPKQLSGGERQRVAMGRAIVREPKVFLMDEPLSNLDAKLRVQMRAEISKLYQKLQTTFIYVTHDQTEAMTLGTRIVIMDKGEIQQVDTPQNVYNHPANLFVAGFIGSPQMNFLNGIFEGGALKIGEHSFPLTDNQAALLACGYAGKEIVLGLRPGDVRVEDTFLAENPAVTVSAAVELVERLGSETYLHLVWQGSHFVASVTPGFEAELGGAVTIGLDIAKGHLFDKQSGLAIDGDRRKKESYL